VARWARGVDIMIFHPSRRSDELRARPGCGPTLGGVRGRRWRSSPGPYGGAGPPRGRGPSVAPGSPPSPPCWPSTPGARKAGAEAAVPSVTCDGSSGPGGSGCTRWRSR
jgi:hypothetical protein